MSENRNRSNILLLGDCLKLLPDAPESSVDSIITDPPYGIKFGGHKWDYDVPSVEIWKECLRVLKPGGHLLAFTSTRTQHRMCSNIEDAGFEVRDVLAWIYGSGFPKNRKLPDGWGSALKPAMELITFARKPLIGRLSDNVEAWGTGGVNIDACRIGDGSDRTQGGKSGSKASEVLKDGFHQTRQSRPAGGRHPANLLLDEEAGELLDIQSGVGASRFFYCAKASKRDRTNDGTVENNHPTVKPTKLMRYLCRLVTPTAGVILDPFCGSGSTGKAAAIEGFKFIGIELNEEYYNIATGRACENEE